MAVSSVLSKSSKFKSKLSSNVNSWPWSTAMLLNLLIDSFAAGAASDWNKASISTLSSVKLPFAMLAVAGTKLSKLMALMSSWLKVKPSLTVVCSS